MRGRKLLAAAMPWLTTAGLGRFVPIGDGPIAGPWVVVCEALGSEPAVSVLLLISTGMSRIDNRSSRRYCGQRSVMSKSFSPSTICVKALPRTAVLMTALTSAACAPHILHLFLSG